METSFDIPQTIFKGFVIGLSIPLFFDFLIIKHTVKEKARYFVLHIIFNSWLSYIVMEDAINCMLYPMGVYNPGYVYSCILSTSAISGFHLYHMLVFTNLSREDVIHHIVSCLICPVLGCLCPFGKSIAISNLGMCGIPGGIDYFLLVCLKYDLIEKITEKYINRWLNLILRWPLMFLTAYVGLAGLFRGGLNDQPSYMIGLMILGTILHSFNAVYYCDKVVGNYHVTLLNENKSLINKIKKNEKTDGLKDDKNDKEENKRECENSKLNMVH